MYFEKIDASLDNNMPTRATLSSAGYDFYLPTDITLLPHQTTIVPLNVRIMPDEEDGNWVLLMYMRSSCGIKKHLSLANGTGVIDKDFQREILAAIYNYGDEPIVMQKNERICQGIITTFCAASNDNCLAKIREGGIGSTGK